MYSSAQQYKHWEHVLSNTSPQPYKLNSYSQNEKYINCEINSNYVGWKFLQRLFSGYCRSSNTRKYLVMISISFNFNFVNFG